MANYYTEFSEVVPNLSDDEIGWLKHLTETIYVYGEEEYSAETLPDGVDSDNADWHGMRALSDFSERAEFEGQCCGFDWQLIEADDGRWGRHFWLYSQECGWAEPTAHFVQKFLQECRPTECWGLTFADHCSKLRIGEFGGGAVFVTATEVKWQMTYGFFDEEEKKFAEQKELANSM